MHQNKLLFCPDLKSETLTVHPKKNQFETFSQSQNTTGPIREAHNLSSYPGRTEKFAQGFSLLLTGLRHSLMHCRALQQSSDTRLNCLWRNLIGLIEGGQEVWNLLFSDNLIGLVLWWICERIYNIQWIWDLGKHSSACHDQTATKTLSFQPLGGIRGKSQFNIFQCGT